MHSNRSTRPLPPLRRTAFYKHELAVAKTASGDVNAGLALFSQLVGPDKAHYNVAYLLRREGKTEDAIQQCQITLTMNPNFEPAKDHAHPDSRPAGGRVALRHGRQATCRAVGSPIQTSVDRNSARMGTSNQPVSGASQASWQPPANRLRERLPVTESDSMLTRLRHSRLDPGQRPLRQRVRLTDPWAFL